MPTLLDRTFKLNEHGTSVKTEILAGVTTFLTMAYILFVNPTILGSTGMPKDAVFVATCVVAALGTIVMALYANYPIAVAPGMGLNAYFAYTVVGSMGYSWQAALGAVFLLGCLFLLISALGCARCSSPAFRRPCGPAPRLASGSFWPSSASATPASWWLRPRPWSRWATCTPFPCCWPGWASSSSWRLIT